MIPLREVIASPMRIFRLVFLSVFLCLPFQVFGTEAQPPMVILISMDGMRHDYPDKGNFPALARMQKEGLRIAQMYPVFPSNTFPGHVSMATGTYPEKHGIIDNSFYDNERRQVFDKAEAFKWIEAEPLWISVVRQGKRSAVYYWLGSEGQWRQQNATYFKSPFKPLGSEADKVRQIIAWMDMPTHERPQLIMSYWHGADKAGHDFGPEHPEVIKAIQKQDKYLQGLLAAIDQRKAWDDVTLMVTSDHGMTEKGKNIDLARLFKEGGFDGYYRKSSALAHLNLKHGYSRDKVYAFLKKQRGFDVYYPDRMPKAISSHHPSRSGELVLVAKPGYRFSAAGFFDNFVEQAEGGMHGMDPQGNEDMRSFLFAMGRGVKAQSRLSKAHIIDIAPTVSALLGLEPPLNSHEDARIFLPMH